MNNLKLSKEQIDELTKKEVERALLSLNRKY
jgi:hypothetical protein